MDLIEDVWFNALNDLEDIDTPANTSIFTDYVTTQWIDGDRQVWNHFKTDGPRTTNRIQGWHTKPKKKVSHAHPNIYTVISIIKDIQATNEVTRMQRNAGGTIRPNAKRYRDIDSRLIQLKDHLTSGRIDVIQYSDATSHLLHLE